MSKPHAFRFTPSLGRQLRAALILAQKTQALLAQAAGLDDSAVSLILSGLRGAPPQFLTAVRRHLRAWAAEHLPPPPHRQHVDRVASGCQPASGENVR